MAQGEKLDPTRIYVEVRYHEIRGGSGSTRMYLDELPAWLDSHWDSGCARVVEQIRRV